MALLACLYMLFMGSPTRRGLLLLVAASAACMLAIFLVALLAGFHVLFVCATLRVVLCHSLSFQWFQTIDCWEWNLSRVTST